MDKHEFKRIWREFRTEVRARQDSLRAENRHSDGHSRTFEPAYFYGGFTENFRCLEATRTKHLWHPARNTRELTHRTMYDTKADRHQTVKWSRAAGRIPLPLEART